MSLDLSKHAPQPVRAGIKDMKVLPINVHLFTILHFGDPPLSGIKAHSAHGATSQEEVTGVREGGTERGRERGRERSGSLRISSFRPL